MSYLNTLGKHINAINQANGWNVPSPGDWDRPDRVAALLALTHSEVSEALEAVRGSDWENFEEELADVLIRVLDLGVGLGVDIDAAVEKKLKVNQGRGHRHGGKRL